MRKIYQVQEAASIQKKRGFVKPVRISQKISWPPRKSYHMGKIKTAHTNLILASLVFFVSTLLGDEIMVLYDSLRGKICH